MMGFGYGMMGMGWIWMTIIPAAFIGLVFYLIVKSLNSKSSNYDGNYNDSRQAIQILNQKFANGEIDEEEYKRKKELITRH